LELIPTLQSDELAHAKRANKLRSSSRDAEVFIDLKLENSGNSVK
jgi:hypothetical protein